jgi:hypothetical protein
MASKELVYTVKIQTEGGDIVEKTAKSANDLRESYNSLQKAVSEQPLGSDKWQELNSALGDTKRAMAEVSEAEKKAQMSTDQLSSSKQGLMDKLSSIPGPVGAAVQGLMGLQKAFMLLVANPIGAILAAIALVFVGLYKAINSTEEGAFKFKQVMAALSGVLNPVIKIVGELATLLVDGVLAGINAVQKGLALLGFDQFAKASDDAQNLAKSITDVEEAEGDLNVERAKQNKELAETREILTDTNASLSDRQKALSEVKKSEEDLAAKETNLSKQKLANIREEIKQKGKTAELLDAEEKALISLYNVEQNQAAVRRKNIKAQQALDREIEADAKEAAAAAKERDKERQSAIDEEKKRKKDAFDFEKNLNLSLITDEQTRALKEAEIRKNEQLEQINLLTTNAQERARLRLLVEQKYQQDLKKIQDDDVKKNEEMLAAIDKLRFEFANNAVETERQRLLDEAKLKLDAQVKEIEGLKITEEQKNQLKIEALNSYNTKRDIINADQNAKELQAAKDKAFKEFDERSKIEQLNFDASIDGSMEQFDIQREMLETNMQKELLMYEGNEAAQTAIKDKYQKKRNEIDRAEQRAKLALLNGVLGAIANLAGEETAIGKAAAIAMTAINTYMAASDMFNKIQGAIPPPFGQILGALAAGIVVAAGTKQGLKIAGIDTSVPSPKQEMLNSGGMVGGIGVGDSVPALLTPGESVINAKSTSMFKGLLSEINEAGGGVPFAAEGLMSSVDSASSQSTPIVKAYVVSTDISNQQEFDRKVVSRSTL